ncbi:MAG: F0F1 ATP synthase subunit A [Rhodobacteraceae bacterium]|nr:F0F1 ATP synthase subunit A [Paracoccaceae bacterium]
MKQFEVLPLFGDGPIYWYTPTNVTLWFGIAIAAIVLLMVLATRKRAVVPGRGQSIAEMIYSFVRGMIVDITGEQGVKYFPYIMTLFLLILFTNVLGLLPMSFTVTAQIAVTGVLAMVVFLFVTILGFVLHGPKFLKIFWITEAPMAVRPILAMIEVISYFVRPVSHSIRLAGNMMAGHAVIKVFAGFAAVLAAGTPLGVGLVAPVAAIMAVIGLELLVVVIQAYVFTVLTCVYLNDALHPGH